MSTETVADLPHLKAELKRRVDDLTGMSSEFKIEDNGGVVVSEEKAASYRRTLSEASQLKGTIEMLEGGAELKAFLDAPAGSSSAMRAEALAAQGLRTPGSARKSLGERFTDSTQFKSYQSAPHGTGEPWELNDADLVAGGRKDIFTASGGYYAQSPIFGTTQFDASIPLQQRRTRVRDLFPAASTNANLIDYFRVSGYTNNARPVAERTAAGGGPATGGQTDVFGVKPQSTLAFSPQQAPVRTIAHFEVAHRNVLADEPQLQATINNELLYGLRLAEDFQILQGDGTGENLRGILATDGIQNYTQANNGGGPTETKTDAVRRSATRAILAYYDPTGVVMHPFDWEDIELTKTTQGAYVVAVNVAVGAQKVLWTMPIVDTPAMPQGTFLTGAFGLGAQLYDREQGNIRIAEQHADFFIRNAVVILAEERLALAVKRPESFVRGTFVG